MFPFKEEKNIKNFFLPVFHQTILPIVLKVLCHLSSHELNRLSVAVELAVNKKKIYMYSEIFTDRILIA